MLISPMMRPVLGLGFSLALFEFAEMRRPHIAFAIGTTLAILFTALAGTFANIRGCGETIVGVATAAALIPSRAVVGYPMS